MKKLLLTCALVGAVTAAFAQGTVQFSNGTLTKMSLITPGVSTVVVPTTAGLINYGLFYGIGQSTSLQLLTTQLGVNSTSSAGIIVNPSDSKSAMNTIQIPGTVAGQTDIWIQFKGWSASFGSDWVAASTLGTWFGVSSIHNVGPLGPGTGPGLSIWQGAAGTASATIQAFGLNPVGIIPEPTTMTLAGLGIASLLIFRRRK